MNALNTRWIRTASIILGLAAAFFFGLSLRGGAPPSDHAGHADHGDAAGEGVIWTCSMDPQIQMPEPGQCPICGMDLIPLAPESGSENSGPSTLVLSERARKLAEIQTTPVRREEAAVRIRMVGKLEADETQVRNISAWVPGRIDRLYVDYTGMSIRAGQKLFDLYSPDLLSAQEELLQAVRAAEELHQSSLESTGRSADRMISAARDRLRLWGLTKKQIEQIESDGIASEHITIFSPTAGIVLSKNAVEGEYVKTGTQVYSIADLSSLWLQLDAYESDLAWLQKGQSVRFETDAFPDETFSGVVSFVDPVLTERSRTVKVRVNVPNNDGRLRPGMFARATLHSTLSRDGDPLPLLIPSSAPLVTGKRAVVYVADPNEAGRFDGRVVSLGPRAGEFYVVYSGLEEGELVVTNGAFKIDSALQIRAKVSMMNPGGGGPAPIHHHGGGSTSSESIADSDAEPTEHRDATSPQDLLALLKEVGEVPDNLRLQFDDLLNLYFDLGTALSHDNFDSAKEVAAKLPAAMATVDAKALPEAARAAWSAAHEQLGENANRLASAATMDIARLTFFDLSRNMIETVRTLAASGDQTVLVYHCPMAIGGTGADWLQSKPGTENPYYGSKMFKCGSQTEVLAAGTSSEAPDSQHD